MNSNIFNSIILSNEQVNYLMGGHGWHQSPFMPLSTHSDCDTTD